MQFVRVLTEKLLIYALGRGTEYYDMPLVRSIVHDAESSDYRFSSLVLGVVKSAPFQMNMKMPVTAARLTPAGLAAARLTPARLETEGGSGNAEPAKEGR